MAETIKGVQDFVDESGASVDVTQNFTLPFRALVPAVVRDFRLMSWTHLGMYDINLIEFIALATFVVAGLLVLRSTTAPVHERVAFVGFVIVEMVIASGQFWDSVFGDGRTYIDAFLLAVIMLLATPSVPSPATAAADGTKKAWVAVTDRVFASNRVITNKRLGILAAIAVAALIVVARRRILFQ